MLKCKYYIIFFFKFFFWSHKLKEGASDPNNSFDNRMDSHKFFQWVENLKERKYIEEFEFNNEISYRIIDKGRDS